MIGGLPPGVLEKALKNIIAQRCMMKPDADYKKKNAMTMMIVMTRALSCKLH